MPIKMYWPRLFFVVFQEIHNFNHACVRRVTELISLPSFMFVGAAVSEVCESDRNKAKQKNLQNGYFQFNIFPRHIIDPFFQQSYLLTISTH